MKMSFGGLRGLLGGQKGPKQGAAGDKPVDRNNIQPGRIHDMGPGNIGGGGRRLIQPGGPRPIDPGHDIKPPRLHNWGPDNMGIGGRQPPTGAISKYPSKTPEQRAAEQAALDKKLKFNEERLAVQQSSPVENELSQQPNNLRSPQPARSGLFNRLGSLLKR